MKSHLKTFLLSLLLALALTPIAIYGHEYKLVVSGIAFCFFTIWRLRKSEETKTATIIFILLPILTLYLPVYLFSENPPIKSLPSTAFHFVGVLFGVFIFLLKARYQKIIMQLVLISLCLFMFFIGSAAWVHKINFDTYTGKILRQAPAFQMEDESGKLLSNQSFKNKTLIIDFWTTSCAVCFKKFPKLEALHSKIKDRPDMIAFAVNVPLKGDTRNKAVAMIREREYSFPILFADQTINDQFEFNAYPTVFIIQNEKIVYLGDIENVESFLGI
jgi:thiol-disulfide isomerase/thioredoxin